MTESKVIYTSLPDAKEAGAFLGAGISEAFNGKPPDALILFASPKYDLNLLLKTLEESCHPKLLVGCSSAGEFASGSQGTGSASAIALRSSELAFAAGIGRRLHSDRSAAAREMTSSFRGKADHGYAHRSALVLTDALAGHADELIDRITLETGGTYQLFGGGAGDDGEFRKTFVFFGTEVATDAAVGLEILSKKPLGIGAHHTWKAASALFRVTEADGMRVVSLNAAPAVEAFEDHAAATGQRFERADPMSFFLHNVLGVETAAGHHLRVPLAVGEDGSVSCAAEIPAGSTVRIMTTGGSSPADAVSESVASALRQLDGNRPGVAIFFDCVATRLRMGRDFGFELNALQESLGPAKYAGCNSYGQIARAEGQFSGFHNCTAVVCVLPE